MRTPRPERVQLWMAKWKGIPKEKKSDIRSFCPIRKNSSPGKSVWPLNRWFVDLICSGRKNINVLV